LTKFSQKHVLKRLRIIAALLLASVAWGSTVEFTHHHGLRRNVRLAQAENTQAAERQAAATQISDPDSRQSSSRSNSGAECSICQLHQNLATSLLAAGTAPAVNPISLAHSQPTSRIAFSEITATLHGRAPPAFLLS
jgi:hypothetical protein